MVVASFNGIALWSCNLFHCHRNWQISLYVFVEGNITIMKPFLLWISHVSGGCAILHVKLSWHLSVLFFFFEFCNKVSHTMVLAAMNTKRVCIFYATYRLLWFVRIFIRTVIYLTLTISFSINVASSLHRMPFYLTSSNVQYLCAFASTFFCWVLFSLWPSVYVSKLYKTLLTVLLII